MKFRDGRVSNENGRAWELHSKPRFWVGEHATLIEAETQAFHDFFDFGSIRQRHEIQVEAFVLVVRIN